MKIHFFRNYLRKNCIVIGKIAYIEMLIFHMKIHLFSSIITKKTVISYAKLTF